MKHQTPENVPGAVNLYLRPMPDAVNLYLRPICVLMMAVRRICGRKAIGFRDPFHDFIRLRPVRFNKASI